MELEDAIEQARTAASWEDQRRLDERSRRSAEEAELKSLIMEAVEKLRPFGDLRLRRCEPRQSRFGTDRSVTDDTGRRYRRVSEQRCWLVVSGELGESWGPIVLAEDGTLGRITTKNAVRCSEKGVFAIRAPLESAWDDFHFRSSRPTERPGSYLVGPFDTGAVKRTLAKAIVAHERKPPHR